MRTLIIAIIPALAFFAGCTGNTGSRKKPVVDGDTKEKANDTAIRTIRGFYSAYITACDEMPARLEEVKEKYCTARLLKALGKEELDYDPFLNAQDCDRSWIATLSVKRDTEEHDLYHVQYKDTSSQESIRLKLRLKHESGAYKIDKVYSVLESPGI